MSYTAEELWTRKQAADFCNVSTKTLDRQGDLPRVKLTARRVVFRKSDLLAWIDRKATGQAA
jgi:predicted DNA-binding transcriptional regulator AlpA